MSKGRLFSLFDDKIFSPDSLVAGPRQNLESLSANVEDENTIIRKIAQLDVVRPKVDFSDFSNFVFFNSALDYFNITGEKILNEFPSDGDSERRQLFEESLDDYQKYVFDVWPKSTGYLSFVPSSHSYVVFDDVGNVGDNSRTSLLNIGTGSFTIESWVIGPPALTGSDDVMILFQKSSGSGEAFTVFFSGSNVYFQVNSASLQDRVSMQFSPETLAHYCFVYDRTDDLPVMRILTGSSDSFPVLVSYVTGTIEGSVNAGSSKFYIGSGSVTSKYTLAFSSSIDDVRVWKEAKDVSTLSSSFNAKIVAQDGLQALWRFNETGSLTDSNELSLITDSSGYKINGRIVNYYNGLRISGSLLPFDKGDPIISLNSPEVVDYIAEQQESGSTYDRDNDNIITRLVPEQFLLLEEYRDTHVLENFLYVLARYFDQLKVSIDQFAYVLRANHGRFDQTPDALLKDVAKFFGWEFTGNFLNSEAIQYIVGKQVLANTESNKELDVKLFEIKNEFWKRTLVELMHIYKTKGTRESVESLLRVYGVDPSVIRLKEYGYKKESTIETHRIRNQKSVDVLAVGSGSQSTHLLYSNVFTTRPLSVEGRYRFPTQTTTHITSSITTGSIWEIQGDATPMVFTPLQQVYFTKESASSTTGSVIFSGSHGKLSTGPIPIFDGEWYNICTITDDATSTAEIRIARLNENEVDYYVTASMVGLIATASYYRAETPSSTAMMSEHWQQEFRVWNRFLSSSEFLDHTLNFQSYGTNEADGSRTRILHWRMDDLQNSVVHDYSGNGRGGTDSFPGLISERVLLDYNFIAPPEYGWNDEKIRSFETSTLESEDLFVDSSMVGLEFNLIDALNEDISQIISTLDNFNEFVGNPANVYRESYSDLDVLRENYFRNLQGKIHFRLFADMLEFFDRSFVSMIQRLLPARAVFLGDEFVVESHMLERSKWQKPYRRHEVESIPEGVIQVFIR